MQNDLEIRTIADLERIIDENPDIRERLRRKLLTDEERALPRIVQQLAEEVRQLAQTVAQGFAEAAADRGVIKTRLNRVEGRLRNIEGTLYEQNAARTAVQLAGIELGIEGPSLAFSKFGTAHPNFTQPLQEAVQSGRISRDDFRNLIRSDAIIYGRNQCHAVVEVSLGPNMDDINRAADRAGILGRAIDETVIPAVAAPDPHPDFIQLAETRNVQVINISA
jgi:hypothetical protein